MKHEQVTSNNKVTRFTEGSNDGAGAINQLVAPLDSEVRKLNADELKAAIKSAWKKYDELAKKEMGQLLYFLRERLRAQGSRNDLNQLDKGGFGACVEQTIGLSRRTADRWADEYGLTNGLMKRKATSRQKTKSPEEGNPFEAHPDDDFHDTELRKHGRLIQMNQWVTQQEYESHELALNTIKKHFKLTGDKEAILKGVQYAAQTISKA